jgi:predicted TIM-barrel fold metal-dependent hydrolase
MNRLSLDEVPNFCAHEHWGSIDAVGMSAEGYRADTEAGALPTRAVSVWDLVLDPYLGGWIAATGIHWDQLAKAGGAADFRAWWRDKPEAALDAMRPHLERQRLTGVFQCIRRGIQFLHGPDIGQLDAAEWGRADTALAAAYQDLYAGYRTGMAKAHFEALLRPVHPEFYWRSGEAGPAAVERSFTHTVMRIDPLLDLWHRESPRRDGLAHAAGVEPADAGSWRKFLDRIFEMADQGGASGIKQLQAYERSLDFQVRKDREVEFTGALRPEQVRAFQDWVVHECCIRANDRNWPHQVHVGTHNLGQSSPLPLESLARRYGQMKIVLLHCWPFIEESGWLAKHLPNVYIDTCWQCILNPEFLRESLTRWLNYVPTHKIMCSHDATSIEMAVGASLFTREILAERLMALGGAAGGNAGALREIAESMLYGNAVEVYGV